MRASAFALALAVMIAAGSARAQSPHAYAYSYEIENADVPADKVLVVWPRTCGASGDPLGVVDLALNPDWATRMNVVDYEVVVKGKKHDILDYCRKTSRLYALPAAAFPPGTRAATVDDTAIGQPEAGAPFAILPALDAIDIKKRIELFDKDPRVLRTTFQFDALALARPPGRPVKSVHEVLAVEDFNATAFVVRTKRSVYTYEDGAVETLPDGDAGADAGAGADASANADAKAAPVVQDIGTRWVLLAAIGGLVLGGFIAFVRKKGGRASGGQE